MERRKQIQEHHSLVTGLEEFYSNRNASNLLLQGYDYFLNSYLGLDIRNQTEDVSLVQDEYIMGPGDEINLTIYGNKTIVFKQLIDTDGMLFLNLCLLF